MEQSIKITKMVGGGTSWFYAMQGGRVLGAAHEDDRAGMDKLRKIKENIDKKDG